MLETSVPITKSKSRRPRPASSRMATSSPLPPGPDPLIDGQTNSAFEAEATDAPLPQPASTRRPRKPKMRSRSRTPVADGDQLPPDGQLEIGQTDGQPTADGQPNETLQVEGEISGERPRSKTKGKRKGGCFCLFLGSVHYSITV